MIRDQEEWASQFRRKRAFWVHDGNPKRPHAILTSDGKHSSGFFNSRLVIPDETLLRDAASDLLELFDRQEGGDVSEVQYVVGPQTDATKLAQVMSYQVMAYNRNRSFWASPAKRKNGERKSMVFSDKDLIGLNRKTALLCEDVLTTGSSVELAATAVADAGGIVLPFILVLVNRSGLTEVNGKKIIALIEHTMPVWTPVECPFCKEGSEALRPKDNWARLNAPY